jgi:predicted component of type VI protein secretion system
VTELLVLPPGPLAHHVLGRGEGCDQQLDHASVSRRHVQVTGSPGRWWVMDLGSRNGTWVNGDRVFAGVGHPLAPHDVLRLGEWEATVAPPPDVDDPDPTTEVVLAAAAALGQLSPYQADVVRQLCAECHGAAGRPATNAEIAARLGTPEAEGAVKAALRRVYAAAGLTDQTAGDKRRELCRIAHSAGWLAGPEQRVTHPVTRVTSSG